MAFRGNLYFAIHSSLLGMQTEEMRQVEDVRSRAQPKVIIGISAYNIEGSVERIVNSLNAVANEIIVCDDASTDSTARIAQTLNCEVITHPHHLGAGATMRSLFLAANRAAADVLLTVSTDIMCDPSDLAKLVDSVAKREADITVGSRFPLKPVRSTESFDKSMLTVYGLPIQDPKSPFRAYSKTAVSVIVSNSLEKADILHAARKLDLGLMEYQISTEPFFRKDELVHSESVSVGPIGGLVDFTSIKHPFIFYETASIIALIVALGVSYLTYNAWKNGFGISDIGIGVFISLTLFLIWIILGVSGTILYSLGKNRIKPEE